MEISFPDEVGWELHETWRARLFEAQSRYKQNRNRETKAEYMRVLTTFKDLVFYGFVPRGQPVTPTLGQAHPPHCSPTYPRTVSGEPILQLMTQSRIQKHSSEEVP
jgi:hypothetical protein